VRTKRGREKTRVAFGGGGPFGVVRQISGNGLTNIRPNGEPQNIETQ